MKKLLLSITLILGFVLASEANTSAVPALEMDNPSSEIVALDYTPYADYHMQEESFNINPKCYKVTEVIFEFEDEDGNVIAEVPGTIIEEIPCPD